MGFSSAIRKARELGRRRIALATARPRMVQPTPRSARPHDAVIVLQRGPNASTDYYLRPRLDREAVPSVVLEIDEDPEAAPLWRQSRAPLVVICRYISERWLSALEAEPGRAARVALFMDDDLPAMVADAGLPASVRGKVAEHFSRHVPRLDAVVNEVWLSSPALLDRYPACASLLPPVPESRPSPVSAAEETRVIYHGADTHAEERSFVVEVARILAGERSPARIELTGDEAIRRACAGLPNVEVVPQLAWPAYLARETGRSAALLLAPLGGGEVNGARAPVKAFDAARAGAAGLYADAPPYRGFIEDGVDGRLLPMQPQAWAEAIDALMRDPRRRRELAEAARVRFTALREARGPLPAPPAA